MLFCSSEYAMFLTAVVAAYWVLPWARLRVLLLLGASIWFYASWSAELAFIVVATSMLDFVLARCIEAVKAPLGRRLLLMTSLACNVGILIYFKYANFFLGSLEQALKATGSQASFPVLSILAPIGISFYTFEAISYVVDVYQRKIPAERNPFHFLLFITFFPHLVSGPIVRGRDFLPQIRRPKRWSWPRAHFGLSLLALGLFKKMAIGDRMAAFVEPVFDHPEIYCTSAIWQAVLAFTIQLYCDFSGYSDMALGAAHLLGYKLTPNFRMPYLATNVSDLWRRWHISLSTWIRDYLYIPLGGSRSSNVRTCVNLVVVMTLGGLWHGANWGFLVWGLLHGVFLVVHRGFQAWCRPRPLVRNWLATIPGTFVRWALTFGSFMIAIVFFRAQTLQGALAMFRGLLHRRAGAEMPIARDALYVLALVVIVAHLFGAAKLWPRLRLYLPTPALGACYAGLVVMGLLLAPKVSAAFLYFQF
jgi:alginate O-acetyltransferase complex protein AlgI